MHSTLFLVKELDSFYFGVNLLTPFADFVAFVNNSQITTSVTNSKTHHNSHIFIRTVDMKTLTLIEEPSTENLDDAEEEFERLLNESEG